MTIICLDFATKRLSTMDGVPTEAVVPTPLGDDILTSHPYPIEVFEELSGGVAWRNISASMPVTYSEMLLMASFPVSLSRTSAVIEPAPGIASTAFLIRLRNARTSSSRSARTVRGASGSRS